MGGGGGVKPILRDTPVSALACLFVLLTVVAACVEYGGPVMAWFLQRPWWWLAGSVVTLLGTATFVVVTLALRLPHDPDKFIPPVPTHRSLEELPELTDTPRNRAKARTETVIAWLAVLAVPVIVLTR